jgi:hypothetical protein
LFNIILLLVAMHVAAIMAYRVIKKQNLVRAMLTGYQPAQGGCAAVLPWLAGGLAVAAAVLWRGLAVAYPPVGLLRHP